jgi:hypothetical protein
MIAMTLNPLLRSLHDEMPMLVVVGDHFAAPQPTPDCVTEMTEINAAGGDMSFMTDAHRSHMW